MTAADSRNFLVHPCHHRAEGHVVAGAADFHDAAVTYLERWGPSGDDEVALNVCDCETGRQECFRFDLATGEVAPCD